LKKALLKKESITKEEEYYIRKNDEFALLIDKIDSEVKDLNELEKRKTKEKEIFEEKYGII